MPGEDIQVTAADGGTFTAYLSTPPSGHGPGLLVLPEIYNANEHIRSVADGFAEEGFVAMSPDVFWRLKPDTYLPYTTAGQAEARALNQSLDVDHLVDDLGACVEALRARRECTGKVGATGFCLGGKLAYLCAARLPIDAAVSYYGIKIDTYLDEADAISCPILFHFAEHDSHVPPQAVVAVTARMIARENATIHVYDGAEHGFNRQGYPPYHAPSAALAMRRTLAHFDAYLA